MKKFSLLVTLFAVSVFGMSLASAADWEMDASSPCYCEYDSPQANFHIMQDDHEVAYGFRSMFDCNQNISGYTSCRAAMKAQAECTCSYDSIEKNFRVTKGGIEVGGNYRTKFDCDQNIPTFSQCR